MGTQIKGRSTVYNDITSEEKLNKVNRKNIDLENDFIDYLNSIDRSKGTIYQYKSNLHVFWCWNLEFNNDKFFVELTKRELIKFQNHAINTWGWSPRRMRVVKATISSLSNYIESILDDEFENYKPIVKKIESPANEAVRDKSIFTQDEINPLLDKLIKDEEYEKACVLALAIFSGRRKAELTRFKVSYFDEKNLLFGGSLYKSPEKVKTKGRGSKGKLLDLYVLAKPFKPYLDLWLNKRNAIGINSDWLFPKYRNGKYLDEHIEVSTIDSYAKTYSRILGKPCYPHSLRHMFCTMLLEQNLPESVVQDILGWSNADMVKLYDDRTKDSQLEKYFNSDGIVQIQSKNIEDL